MLLLSDSVVLNGRWVVPPTVADGVIMTDSVPATQLKSVLLSRTVDIVSAYVGKNKVTLSNICDIIGAVHNSLGGLTYEVVSEP